MGDIGLDETVVPAPRGDALDASWGPARFEERYVVGERIGAGGMGEVWAARDRVVGRDVAIKRLRTDAAVDAATRDALIARFFREARVQGRLEHPAIVPVHDVGVDGEGRPYLVMKRIAGVTLRDVLVQRRRGDAEALRRWPRRRLLADLVTVCRALELAHRRGVVHRDVKPSNVMLGDLGEVYLLDWGVARILDESDDAVRASRARDVAVPDAAATEVGAWIGTPGYMAPEQERGEPVDARADVYAAGRVLREIVDDGDDAPPELAAACARAVAKDRDERHASIAELADAIDRYLAGDRDLAQRRRLAAEHATTAQLALSGEVGAAERALAMREAGRALALDPTCAAAQAIASRLLLEPPAVTPPDVLADLDRDEQAALRRHARLATAAYGFYLCCVPLLFAVGVKTIAYPAAIAGLLLVQIAHTAWLWRRARRIGEAAVVITLVLDATLIGLIALVAGAFFIAPALAMGVTLMYVRNTRAGRPALVAPIALGAIVVPLLLELTGAIPRIYRFADGDVIVSSFVIELDRATFLLACLAFLAVTVALVAYVTGEVRAQSSEAERRLRLQAWQLAQLAPR